MTPIELMQLHKPTFTKSDEKIYRYILDNLDFVSAYPIIDVAAKAGVSKSALLRFCQKLGYTGYSEFKYELSKHLLSGTFKDPKSIRYNTDLIGLYISCIEKIPKYISDEKFTQLCILIKEARKIKIYGVHESGLSAEYLSFRLASLGVDSEPVTFPGIFAEKARFAAMGDLNLFSSVSGTTGCIAEAAAVSFSGKAATAIITQNSKAMYYSSYDSFIFIPSLNTDTNQLFLDSQAVFCITIDLLINKLARLL